MYPDDHLIWCPKVDSGPRRANAHGTQGGLMNMGANVHGTPSGLMNMGANAHGTQGGLMNIGANAHGTPV